jgi:hypothetical protein
MDNDLGSRPKKLSLPPSIVIILQFVWSLLLRFFLQTIGIIRFALYDGPRLIHGSDHGIAANEITELKQNRRRIE